jgi:hypothetical protein
MFLINTYQWEWTTIAALVAPRPLLFANSDDDRIFPMDGNRRIIARLRKLYQMYEKPDVVDDYISKGGHDYRPDLRIAIFKWINKHIKNDTGPVKDSADFKPFANEELRAFPEDKDIPKDAINGKIDETFVPRARVKLPEEGKFAEWKTGLMKELREKSFRGFPDRVPAATLLKEGPVIEGYHIVAPEPNATAWMSWPVQQLGFPPVMEVAVLGPQDERRAVTKWAAAALPKERYPCLLEPRGVGSSTWTSKSPPNYVERGHALVGRTVDERRVWDIAAALRYTGQKHGRDWIVIGRGQSGILAAYAALFEPSIKEVVIVDPPTSHKEGPTFLNILRVLDIPEALGMLAPRPLTLVNAKDKAFDRTAEIYKRAGAAEKFQRK